MCEQLKILKVTDGETEKALLTCGTYEVEVEDLLENEAELELIEQTVEFVAEPENNAAGMAAPQVGSINSWFVMKTGPRQIVVVLNPEIIARDGRKQYIEGCFSEEHKAQVKRSRFIIVNYTTLYKDEDDNWQTRDIKLQSLSGSDAQVFQHEYDHLRGVLLSDKKGSKVIKDA